MAESYRYGYPFRLAVRPLDIEKALRTYRTQFRSRVFDPQTTIYSWMSQIAAGSASCRQAVAEVVAWHATQGQTVSARTGAYTQARQRLDVRVIRRLARDLARRTEAEAARHWILERPVFAVDGTNVSCPDSLSITRRYPKQIQDYAADGLGFPTIRLLLIVSQTTGAVLNLQIAPFRGKHTGELSMFVRSWKHLQRGDVVVGDRMFSPAVVFHWLPYRGVDLVVRKNEQMRIDRFPVQEVYGRNDKKVVLQKPSTRSAWMIPLMHRRTPTKIPVRTISLGTRGREGQKRLHLLSTLGADAANKPELAEIYRQRWNVETDIRSIKEDLGADILTCKTAEMLDKELWMTILVNNAVRYLMARAASRARREPRSVSFAGALHAIRAFGPRLAFMPSEECDAVIDRMYDAMASHVVGNRPCRVEPRAVKRRRKPINKLTVSREEARARARRGDPV